MFSQRDEERVILEYFGDKADGFFLDIGAADGKTFSNTHALALRGWWGWCVEPNPHMLVALMKLYEDREDITIIARAAVPFMHIETVPDVEMWVCPDFVSTTEKEHMEKWAAGGTKFRKMEVGALPVGGIELEPCDMINIDVEGNNLEILEAMNIGTMHDCKLLCIEHDNHKPEIELYCEKFGLKRIHETAENLILAR